MFKLLSREPRGTHHANRTPSRIRRAATYRTVVTVITGPPVSEIEERLNALEKRARADDERWQTLDGQSKASRIILVAIGAPICAANPELLHPIIKNLSDFEHEARLQNQHFKMIEEIRYAREFFESRRSRIQADSLRNESLELCSRNDARSRIVYTPLALEVRSATTRSAAAVRPLTFATSSFPLVTRLRCVCERSALAWIERKHNS